MFSRSYEVGSIIARFLAFVIDNLLLGVVGVVLASLSNDDMTVYLAGTMLITFSYLWVCWTQNNGQTLGHMLFGLRVIKMDGRDLNTFDVLLRLFGYIIGALVFGLGYLWVFFDEETQAWHDKIASTFVVRI